MRRLWKEPHRIRGAQRPLGYSLARTLSQGADPILLGIEGVRLTVLLRLVVIVSAPVSGILLYTLAGPLYVVPAITVQMFIAMAAPRLYRVVVGSNIDRELPSLLLYLLPFSWSTKSVADVIVGLSGWRKPPFKWVSREAARLKLILDMGYDPVKALSVLAETTPSGRLRYILEMLVDASRTGLSREALASDLASTAIDEVRRSWSRYIEVARVSAEASVALIVAAAVLVPIAAFTGSGLSVLVLTTIVPALAGLALMLYQPELGLNASSSLPRLASLAAVFSAVVASLLQGGWAALAVLVPAAAAIEVLSFKAGRRSVRALVTLRKAVDRAKLGMPIEEELMASRPVLGRVVDALLEAVSVAGTVGVWGVMDRVYRAVSEAMRRAAEARLHALVLAGVSAIAPAIAMYSITLLSGMSEGTFLDITGAAAMAESWIRAAAAVIPLPAAVLYRPRAPTLVPSIVSIATLMYIS